jgi:succinate dehydrogenase/fumarate reductase flavoprotein subunit
MTEKVGVFRTEAGLREAIDALNEFKRRVEKCAISTKSIKMNPELVQRWEMENLLNLAMVIAQGALQRRESRGGHYRMDFPERKDAFNHHTLAYMSDLGNVRFEKKKIDMSLYEAKGEHHEKFDVIERKY